MNSLALRFGIGLLCAVSVVLLPQQSSIRSQIEIEAKKARGRVGVSCSVPGVELACDYHADEKFPMQSVYKLPIAMAMLDAIEHGKFKLETKVRFLPSDLISADQRSPLRDAHPRANVDVKIDELLRLAVVESDGVASDIVVRQLGGVGAVDKYVRRLGIDDIRIVHTEKELGKNDSLQYADYATPRAMVTLLRLLVDKPPLSPEHTAMLLNWMTITQTGEHRLKANLTPGTVVAHKTGTSGQNRLHTNATNDVGLITLPNGQKFAIAVFVADSRESVTVREAVIATIADDIWRSVAERH